MRSDVGAAPLERWSWPESDTSGVSRLWSDLNERGTSFFRCPEAADQSVEPAQVVERLLGVRPTKVAVVAIKPEPETALTLVQRRSYPHTTVAARFHVDPDPEGVLPPHVQVMICRRQAAQGGESLILDVWRLLAEIEATEPDLFRQLFETPRRLSFPGNDAFGPTIACRQGNLVCFHGAVPPSDGVGRSFRKWIDAATPFEFRAEAGDVYINNNHRTLHGRRAFTDSSREFLRILAWFREPLAAPDPFLDRAGAVSRALSARMTGEPLWVRQAFGFDLPTAEHLGCFGGTAPGLDRRLRRRAWYASVPPGTPPEHVQARLDAVLDRLRRGADAVLERAEGR
jgi:Taurine catabolism dioxygenase TauD, TfdA family